MHEKSKWWVFVTQKPVPKPNLPRAVIAELTRFGARQLSEVVYRPPTQTIYTIREMRDGRKVVVTRDDAIAFIVWIKEFRTRLYFRIAFLPVTATVVYCAFKFTMCFW